MFTIDFVSLRLRHRPFQGFRLYQKSLAEKLRTLRLFKTFGRVADVFVTVSIFEVTLILTFFYI